MSSPLVYVLVINWDGIEHLDDCLRSLVESDYANARFLLIDNASDDESVAFVRDTFGHDKRIELLELPANLGWSGGNNAGMQHAIDAGADYVLLLNNDTRIAMDAISKLVEVAKSNPEIGALAPKLLMFYEDDILNSIGLEASTIGASWDRGIGRIDSDRWSGVTETVGVCGAGMFLRVQALHRTGLLPRDFEIYLDDLDLCLRIWDAGYRILTCPEARIWHKFSATMGEGTRVRRKYYLNTRNRARIILRNFPPSRMRSVLSDYILGEVRAIGRALGDRELWRVGAHARSWFAAALYYQETKIARHERRGRGLAKERYWHLIQRRPQFFPGTLFPEKGWYPLITVNGEYYRPIARVARYAHPGGTLEIRQANPYPEAGSVSIRVMAGDRSIASLSGNECHETRLQVDPAEIVFIADTVFAEEETGSPHDAGGWLRVRSIP